MLASGHVRTYARRRSCIQACARAYLPHMGAPTTGMYARTRVHALTHTRRRAYVRNCVCLSRARVYLHHMWQSARDGSRNFTGRGAATRHGHFTPSFTPCLPSCRVPSCGVRNSSGVWLYPPLWHTTTHAWYATMPIARFAPPGVQPEDWLCMYPRVATFIPVSVNKQSFHSSLCPAIQRQKLLSSP